MANLLMTFNAPSLVSIIGLVVVLLLTALVLRSTSYTIASGSKGYSYIIHSDRLQGLYEDEDGTATVGHEESFSARSFTTIALLCAIISVLLSLSTGIWSSLEPEEALLLQRWLLFGGWVNKVACTRKDLIADPAVDSNSGAGVVLIFRTTIHVSV